jgi:hypothetical protein
MAATVTLGIAPLLLRTMLLALVGVLVFGLFERWPKRLPGGLARWVLQVVGVGLAMPATTVSVYLLSTRAGAPDFWQDKDRMEGCGLPSRPWSASGRPSPATRRSPSPSSAASSNARRSTRASISCRRR